MFNRIIHASFGFLIFTANAQVENKPVPVIYSTLQSITRIHSDNDFSLNMSNEFKHSLLQREKTLKGGSYVHHMFGEIPIYPAFIPEEERRFWRTSLQQYVGYIADERPFRSHYHSQEDSQDIVWQSFLLSKYSDCDLILYLRANRHSYPFIVLFQNGKLLYFDSRNMKSSSGFYDFEVISRYLSNGIDSFSTWSQGFQQALKERPISDNQYSELIELFSKINQSAISFPHSFSEAEKLYQTDINFVRDQNGLTARPVFNMNGVLTIVNKDSSSTYKMVELYYKEELPSIIQKLCDSLLQSSSKNSEIAIFEPQMFDLLKKRVDNLK